MRWATLSALFFVLSIATPSLGQSINTLDANLKTRPAISVFEGDSDRPYRIIGKIDDNLRKHFAFQANPTKEKIYAEIWERGRKMGADAVINVRYGPTVGTLFNHGRTPISGTAIRFTDTKTQVN